MRTTLELDDDLINLARQLAQQRGATMGEVVSELMRQGLRPKNAPSMRNGVPLLVPKTGAPVMDLESINRLRDEE